jgi:hypothetical protein
MRWSRPSPTSKFEKVSLQKKEQHFLWTMNTLGCFTTKTPLLMLAAADMLMIQ